MKSTTLDVPNAILLVLDLAHPAIPESLVDSVAFSQSCLVISCKHPSDGQTTIQISPESEYDETSALVAEHPFAHFGLLTVKSKSLSVCTVELRSVFEVPVEAVDVSVLVRTNHLTEPDRILIVYR